MKTVFTAVLIVGVLIFLAGAVFALQGDGTIGGSAVMSGNPFWIYAGLGIAVIGLAIAFVGLVFGSRKTSVATKTV